MASSSTPSTKASSYTPGEERGFSRVASSGSIASANSYKVDIDTIIANNLPDVEEKDATKPRGILKRSSELSYRDIPPPESFVFPQRESNYFGSYTPPARPPGSFPSIYDDHGEQFDDECSGALRFLGSVVPRSTTGPRGETYYYIKNPRRLRRCLLLLLTLAVVITLSITLPKRKKPHHSNTPGATVDDGATPPPAPAPHLTSVPVPTAVPTPYPTTIAIPNPTPVPTSTENKEKTPPPSIDEDTQQETPDDGETEPKDPEEEVAVDPEDGETPIESTTTPVPTSAPSGSLTAPSPTSIVSPTSPTSVLAPTQSTPAPTSLLDCSFLGTTAVNVDPFLQCACNNQTSFTQGWSQAVDDREATLRSMLPSFMLPSDDSNACTPVNMAFQWLALDLVDHAFLQMTDVERFQQRYTMAYLYAVWNGGSWSFDEQSEWLGSNTECDWNGLECNDDSRVTSINLAEQNIAGSIPSHLGYLAPLVHLDLSKNSLLGELPLEFFFLKNLVTCNLSSNDLQGTLPMEITILTDLEHLDLKLNNFSSSITPQYGDLVNLTHLDLQANQLTGEIPDELTYLRKLTTLALAENDIGGTVPSGMDLLTDLEVLRLHTMNLEGSLPMSIVLIDTLQELRLGENAFNGTIPPALGDLTKLTYLSTESNRLGGTLPTELGSLTKMQLLTLGNNVDIHGSIPIELAGMTDLVSAHFAHMPLLTGTVPFCTVYAPKFLVLDCTPQVACPCCSSNHMINCSDGTTSSDRNDGGLRGRER